MLTRQYPPNLRKLVIFNSVRVLVFLAWASVLGSSHSQTIPSVSASDSTFYLSATGTLQATGFNQYGQSGIGDEFSRALFQTVPFPQTAKRVWTGNRKTYVLKTDGTLWVSGEYAINQNYLTLIQVGTDSDWKELSHAESYTLAIKQDGSLWSWGFGFYGVLGQGSFSSSLTNPTRVETASDWALVAAGPQHVHGIKKNGTLWSWGNNSNGNLGNGSTSWAFTPIQIGTANDWQSVAAGSGHSLAIRADGSLWAWGSNSYGQLGDGSTALTRTTPVRIGTSDQWESVSAGARHSLALMEDKSLHAWGSNTDGQLGVGDTLLRNAPTPVSGGGTWQAFAAGTSHSAALKSDGTLMVWGSNTHGQLGPQPLAAATTPQTADFSPHPEISLSTTANPVSDSHLVADGAATLAFPLIAENLPSSAPVTIYNHGTTTLSVSAVTIPSGFSVSPQAPFDVAPGASQVLSVAVNTQVTGARTGQMTIISNDANEGIFDLTLSANVLSFTKDTDGDGLNDAAEWHYSSFGFTWDVSQPWLVSSLISGAKHIGMIANISPPGHPRSIVVGKSPAGNSATVHLRAERATNLADFSPLNLSAPSISNDGSFVIPLTQGTSSGFYRFAVENPPATSP